MRLLCLLFAFGLFLPGFATAQGYAWGIKGGPTVGFQQWNSFEQDALFEYHGIVFIESIDAELDRFALFSQLGYHVKGSAIRNSRATTLNGNIFNLPTQEFQFRNLSLSLGGKQKYNFGKAAKAYYLLAIRGDFTINTNLSEYHDTNIFSSSFYPSDNWVRRWNYGGTVGAGLEFPFGELIGGILEFTVNPDVSRQYWQPALGNIPAPWDPGTTISVQERRITNITLELTFGLRFLRIVEYID